MSHQMRLRRKVARRWRPRTALGEESPPPEHPSAGPPFAARATNLESLRDAVVDAARVGTGLWLSYLFVLFYLAIAVGGVTHRDLLFENPVKLPFLNVDLPLLGFFVLGPLVFLIVHAYVLLHCVLLADKIGAFQAELEKQITDADTRARLRRQLPSNMFVQRLSGPREVRMGMIGFMLRLIGQISLVVSPLALLALFQLQFLPYHHAGVTWWQRFAVLADLLLLWFLWPSVELGRVTRLTWRDLRLSTAGAALASVMLIALVFTIATLPDERLNRLPSLPLVPTKWPQAPKSFHPDPPDSESGAEKNARKDTESRWSLLASLKSMKWTSLHELLIAGGVDQVVRKPASLWSNRLVLPGIDGIDHAKLDSEEKIAAVRETLSLRGRRLDGAVLIGARLRKVDFTAARLRGALLDGADLREATFDCEQRRRDTPLQGDSLAVPLHCAQLQGASLASAQLQGASLEFAHLEGAVLYRTQLQGASLLSADLEGAALVSAELQGANLHGAQLQGAWLDHVNLQGASLLDATFDVASLNHVLPWRADPAGVSAAGALIVEPDTRCQRECAGRFAMLKRFIEKQLPNDARRRIALERIEILDPKRLLEAEKRMTEDWVRLAQSPRPLAEYENDLVVQLRTIGCDPDGAPYVISGLLRFTFPFEGRIGPRFSAGSQRAVALAAAFLDRVHCAGARGLSDEGKAYLRKIAGGPPPMKSP